MLMFDNFCWDHASTNEVSVFWIRKIGMHAKYLSQYLRCTARSWRASFTCWVLPGEHFKIFHLMDESGRRNKRRGNPVPSESSSYSNKRLRATVAVPDSTTDGFPRVDYFPFERVLKRFRAADIHELLPNLRHQIEEEVAFIWSLISEYERVDTLPEGENTYYASMTTRKRNFIDTRCSPSVAVLCLVHLDDDIVIQRDRAVEKDLAELKRLALMFTEKFPSWNPELFIYLGFDKRLDNEALLNLHRFYFFKNGPFQGHQMFSWNLNVVYTIQQRWLFLLYTEKHTHLLLAIMICRYVKKIQTWI